MADRERSRSPDGSSAVQNGAGAGGGGSPPPENAGGGGDYNGGGDADGVKLYVGNLDYGAYSLRGNSRLWFLLAAGNWRN
jgi:hypothetical protein